MKKINKQRLQQLAGIPLREQEQQYKSAMEVTIRIPRQILKLVVESLEKDFSFKTSIANLATNPTFQKWLISDVKTVWFDSFSENLESSLENLNLNKIKGTRKVKDEEADASTPRFRTAWNYRE